MTLNAKKTAFILSSFLLLLVTGASTLTTASAAKDERHKWNKKKWGPMVPHTKFPKDCSLCHVAKRWDVLRSDFKFDHEKETGYALEGEHAQASCLRCHNDRGPVKAYVSRGCSGCHADPHRSTLGFDCKRCHNQITWQPTGIFATHAQTVFPLTGRHASVQCEQCHQRAKAGDFKGTPTACFACHAADFQRAPNHAAMNFSRQCQSCHTTLTWTGARFNHSQLGANPNCFSCHAADFQRGPNHVSQNYPHTCQNCHNTTSWAAAPFNHASLGANPNCFSCHQADFQGATNHVSLNFSHTCQSCHTTTTWSPSTFNHTTFFPLQGNHNVNCNVCHNSGSTASFNCLASCHSQNQTNSNHNGVNGYSYTSAACYQCHPNGRN